MSARTGRFHPRRTFGATSERSALIDLFFARRSVAASSFSFPKASTPRRSIASIFGESRAARLGIFFATASTTGRP